MVSSLFLSSFSSILTIVIYLKVLHFCPGGKQLSFENLISVTCQKTNISVRYQSFFENYSLDRMFYTSKEVQKARKFFKYYYYTITVVEWMVTLVFFRNS